MQIFSNTAKCMDELTSLTVQHWAVRPVLLLEHWFRKFLRLLMVKRAKEQKEMTLVKQQWDGKRGPTYEECRARRYRGRHRECSRQACPCR